MQQLPSTGGASNGSATGAPRGRSRMASALLHPAMAMRTAVRAHALHADEALLIGLTGLVLVTGLTLGGGTPLAYLVVALPVVLGVTWSRPVYGFAFLLGVVLLTEEFEIPTLAGGIDPWLLQTRPIFRNIEGLYANTVELWIVLVTAIWLAKGLLARRLRLAPVPCPTAWLGALLTIGAAFAFGMLSGGDFKPALWEVRALGYLLGLAWLVPQIVESRRDLVVILSVVSLALGAKALQGLYRYVVVLQMQLDLSETFMAHEDPVMFVPLFYLLIGLWHYRGEPWLRRILLATAPLMLVALVFTQRRVAYIGLGICAICFALELSAPARRAMLRLALPFVLLAAGYVVLFAGSSSPLGQPIARFLQLFEPDNTSNLYRLLELENLRYTIEAHPWGIGFGHPYEIIRSLPKLEFPLQDYIPHNEVMWVWVKTGTLGFIVVMYFFGRLVAEGAWTYRHVADPLLRVVAAVVPLAIVNQLVASSFEMQLTYTRNMMYLGTLIGLLAPIQRWSGLLAGPRSSRHRWRLLRGID